MPRVTPVIPPILEAKSNQVIFSALENSARERKAELKLSSDRSTKCRGLAKKDVQHGNILFVGIVGRIFLRVASNKERHLLQKQIRIHLWKGRKDLSFAHNRFLVFPPDRWRQPTDVFQSIPAAPVSLIHSRLPLRQHGVSIQSAERTQVHIPGITTPANSVNPNR